MRRAVAALIWLGTLSILAGQLIGIAAVLQVAGGWPPYAGYLVGALVAVTYFVAGGLLSSAWVNVVQLLFILAGFAIAVPAAVQGAGGWSQATSHGGVGFFGDDAVLGWRYIFILAPAFIVSPGLLQKAFGARDARAVKIGIAVNGLMLLIFAFAPAILGLSARALFPDLAKPDLALPTLMTNALPAALGALALAAVFSAEVSTADAVLFMLATSGSRDLYASFINPRRNGRAARSRRPCSCHHRRLRRHRARLRIRVGDRRARRLLRASHGDAVHSSGRGPPHAHQQPRRPGVGRCRRDDARGRPYRHRGEGLWRGDTNPRGNSRQRRRVPHRSHNLSRSPSV